MARTKPPLPALILTWLLLPWGAVGASAAEEFQILPGDRDIGPAIGSQTASSVATGGGGSLVVWQDLRTSPFNGPPFTPLGRSSDIYSLRLDANGVPLDAAPVPIATSFTEDEAPRVVWNGRTWLVAWLTTCECWSYSSLLRATRITPDGQMLDDPPIVVATNAGSRFQVAAAGEDAMGTEWLLVPDTLRGYRVSPDGVVVNPGGTPLHDPTTIIFLDLAWAQGEYLLVRHSTASTSPVYGQRHAADLSLIDGPFVVPSRLVASSGDGYFFQWAINDTYWDDWVRGQRMSVDGIFGPVVTAAGTGGGLPIWNPTINGVAWDGTNWWMAWAELFRGVVFSRVTTGDVVLEFGGQAVDPTAADRDAQAFDVSGRPGGGAQFAWQDSRAGGEWSFDIHSTFVDTDAIPGPPEILSTSARAQLFPDFAAGETEILAVFRSELSGDLRIVAQRLDGAGNAIDAEPFVIASGPTLSRPHVGFDGTRYMVVWEDGDLVYARRVLTDGTVLDTVPLLIMEGRSPDVAGLDGTFLVVATDEFYGIHFFHPFSMRVDGATGATLDAAPVLLGQYYARNPRVIDLAGRWLATWQRNVSHDNPQARVMAAFVESNGTTTGEFEVEGGGVTPHLASAGDRALFAWTNGSINSGHNNVKARLMASDGTFLADSFFLANTDKREFDPSVTWDGTDFVIAWTDMRNSQVYFDYQTEVFGARVSYDGALVDPLGFAFGDRALPERDAAAVSFGGHTFLAASSHRDDPALQTYRLAVERFGNALTGNRWPVAVASASTVIGDVDLTVNFDSAGSYDPDGVITSIIWDFGDGGSASGAAASHTYTVAGNYLAQVEVIDDQGASTRNVVRVVATNSNQTPIAVANADRTSGKAPLAVIFKARESYDPDQGIQNWRWDFSDGGSYYGETAYHTFQTGGTHSATLTVFDFRGASASDSITIDVGEPNVPPTAIASADPLSGVSPVAVSFSSAGSDDTDGAIVGYRWSFGDGDTSNEESPTHVYAAGGLFVATLTVTDNDGGTGTNAVTIDVIQGDMMNVATSDYATTAGAVTGGSYLSTHVADGSSEALAEEQTGGNPSKRKSMLSHTWTFDVMAGPYQTFHVEAFHTDNGEGDDFMFEYSKDGVSFSPMLVVSATAPGSGPQTFAFSEDVSGPLYIRVGDTDRSEGSGVLDTLYVDALGVMTSWLGGADTDGDGVSDGADCAPLDIQAWDAPGEVLGLSLTHTGGAGGTTTLSWAAPASPGGVAVVYDTVSSTVASDFTTGACAEANDGSDTIATDTTALTPGQALFFLVRAGNACSEGNSGTDSAMNLRNVVSCP